MSWEIKLFVKFYSFTWSFFSAIAEAERPSRCGALLTEHWLFRHVHARSNVETLGQANEWADRRETSFWARTTSGTKLFKTNNEKNIIISKLRVKMQIESIWTQICFHSIFTTTRKNLENSMFLSNILKLLFAGF